MQEALNSEVYVFLSDVETDVWPQGTVANLTQQSARWLITRGEHGADEVSHKGMQSLPPYKVRHLIFHRVCFLTFLGALAASIKRRRIEELLEA